MGLSKKQIEEIRIHLDECKNPLFLFDDDQDGLCSFLQLYRYKREGKGFIVKTVPKIDISFVQKAKNYNPDKIFILDMAIVEQEFLDEVNVSVIWIDHHQPLQREKVHYYNPRNAKPHENFPTSYLCHQIVEQDHWIAAVGCVADWVIPEFLDDVKKEFPDLINSKSKNPGDIIYNTQLGHLIRIISFVLKGKSEDVSKCIKIMTRIKSPYEILNKETPEGKFLYKRFEAMNKLYEPLLDDAINEAKNSGKIALFKYYDGKMSFTSDLGNELIYKFPDKIIIIAREKNGDMKCSLRSSKIDLRPLIEKSLIGLSGYGGGHEHACGLNVSKPDFDEFLRRFEEMI